MTDASLPSLNDPSPSQAKYAAYLETFWWRRVREAALERANYTCGRCGYRRLPYKVGMPKRLEVHHLNYGCLWRERPGDLAVLCEDCHADAHGLPHRPPKVAGDWVLVGDLLKAWGWV
jgi:5-methylcytosine-specific restriction endonuclease McrA